jgi:hypothetical protein
MAKKGEFRPPAYPLREAFERATDIIYGTNCAVAVFMVGGRITTAKKTSEAYERRVALLANHLIGVYDQGADARVVMDDLREFYKDAA